MENQNLTPSVWYTFLLISWSLEVGTDKRPRNMLGLDESALQHGQQSESLACHHWAFSEQVGV